MMNPSRHARVEMRYPECRARLTPGKVVQALGLSCLLIVMAGCHDREVSRGAAIYAERCASCHGPEGRGQNPARPWGSIAPEQEGWIAPALDMRGHCYQHPRKQLIAIIRNGSSLKGSTMLGFKDKLSEDQINSVVTYLESLWDRPTRKQFQAREQSIPQTQK
jgi:mono/diheme cytochrome c family protein